MASACVPSSVSAIRTPKLPLLPLWEKGAGGMRGKSARECRTSLISPKNSTLECRCKPDGSNAAGSAHLRRAEALAEVGQALRAGSTQVPLAHGQDNRHASPAGASMRSGRASARTSNSASESRKRTRIGTGITDAHGWQRVSPPPQPGWRQCGRIARASGRLKPWLRSGTPCGLDQPWFPWHMARITDTPAPQGLPCAQGGLQPARAESRPTTDGGRCLPLPTDACRSPRGGE